MKPLQRLLSRFNGLLYTQEYLCLGLETFEQPIQVYLVMEGGQLRNITTLHCFVGYCPLVFVIQLSNLPREHSNIKLLFSQQVLKANSIPDKKDILAQLWLRKIHQQELEKDAVVYFEGSHTRHRFLNRFQQGIIQLNNRLYQKKPGNVFLAGNLYKQVQVAYSYPRIISLITIGYNDLFNLFPTDLHGQLGNRYFISLRQKGKACQQVQAAGKILLSQVNSSFYKTVYGLGKNHMQPMKNKEIFEFGDRVSPELMLPVPQEANLCRELELEDYFDQGIHRIMIFRVLTKSNPGPSSPTLAHIHNSYATWRYKNGLPGNYLMR